MTNREHIVVSEVMPANDRVYDKCHPGSWSSYWSLERWQRACTGMDVYGCRVYAFIDGDRLRVQHGDDPEAVRWFTLAELNHENSCWFDGSPDSRWHEEIHEAARRTSFPETVSDE